MYRSTNQNPWAQFEPVRRQRRGPAAEGPREGRREGRGHGRRPGEGSFGPPWGGPPPWVAQMFGPQWGGHPGGRGPRRARVRRGDVRGAILDVLAAATEPLNGYQMIQQIAERSSGAWKPSPGSVYPTVAQLVDEGLVEDAPTGRKTLRLTEAGTAYVAEHGDELAAIWAGFDHDGHEDSADFRQVIQQTVAAIVQIASTGTAAQQDRAVEILADARRKLYGLLAEGPDAAETEEER